MNNESKDPSEFVVEITRPYFGMLVALGAKDTENTQELMNLKARLMKEAILQLKEIDSDEHSEELTAQIIDETWAALILPELNYMGFDTGGNPTDDDFEFHEYFMEPSLVFTDEKIESSGSDWASPETCLSIFNEYLGVEETQETEETETEETETEETEETETEETEEVEPEDEECMETCHVDEPCQHGKDCDHEGSGRLREGSFREASGRIPDKSLDVIVANPPYAPSDRSNGRLIHPKFWKFFTTVAAVEDTKDIPGVIETLSSKGLITSQADMLDAMCFLLVATETINLKDASLIFDRFGKLS